MDTGERVSGGRDEPAKELVQAQSVEDAIENTTETDAVEDVAQKGQNTI